MQACDTWMCSVIVSVSKFGWCFDMLHDHSLQNTPLRPKHIPYIPHGHISCHCKWTVVANIWNTVRSSVFPRGTGKNRHRR
jgi:hypothetical protein